MANFECSSLSIGRAPKICLKCYLIIRAAHQSRTTVKTTNSKYISLSPFSTDSTPQTRHLNGAPSHKISLKDPLNPHFLQHQVDIHRRIFQPRSNSHSSLNKHRLISWYSRHRLPLGKRLLRLQRRIRPPAPSIHPAIATLPRRCPTRRPQQCHLPEGMAKRHRRTTWGMDVSRKRHVGDDAE